MPTRLPKTLRLSARAQRFYSQIFTRVYESIQNAACRTPLVIMLWGPRRRSREWSHKRLDIRNELEQLGHTAFFSEQLGVPIAAVSKKGVEFLQSEAADLIIAVQSLYGLVGGVNHFVEFRVADAKMLLFIDEAAPDRNQYERALVEMQARYNNVDTFNAQEEATHNALSKKIVDKVRVIQMVKYRAIQNTNRWGLRSDDYTFSDTRPQGNVQPFRYNLLELYREHRNEIDLLMDPLSLFILAFVNQLGKTSLQELSNEITLAHSGLSQKVEWLQRAEMLTRIGGVLGATGYGEHVLNSLGFPASAPATITAPQSPLIKWDRVTAMATGAGVALAVMILLFIAAVYGTGLTQKQAPLELTPVRSITVSQPFTPTHTVSPHATVTPPAH